MPTANKRVPYSRVAMFYLSSTGDVLILFFCLAVHWFVLVLFFNPFMFFLIKISVGSGALLLWDPRFLTVLRSCTMPCIEYQPARDATFVRCHSVVMSSVTYCTGRMKLFHLSDFRPPSLFTDGNSQKNKCSFCEIMSCIY